MSKRAPLAFVCAAILLLGAMGLSQRDLPPDDERVPLDFTGIDTLVVVDRAEANKDSPYDPPMHRIQIDSTQAPVAEHARQKAPRLRIERQGGTLLLTLDKPASDHYRAGLSLAVPANLKRISVERADIVTRANIDALELEIGTRVEWSGSARSLVIREQRRERVCECDCSRCSASVAVRAGTIDELRVETSSGSVLISKPQTVRSGTLALGPEASLTIGRVGSMANLQIVPYAPEPASR